MRAAVVVLLVVPSLSAQEARPATARDRHESLLKEYEGALEEWNKRFDSGAGGDAKFDWEARYREWPGRSFAARFLELAEEHPEDPIAIDALLWVASRSGNIGVGDRKLYVPYRRALEMLARRDHLQDERLGAACRRTFRHASPPTERLLRVLVEKSENRVVRGPACVCLAMILVSKARVVRYPWFESVERNSEFEAYLVRGLDPEYIEYIHKTDPRASEDEAQGLFDRAMREYGDLIWDVAPGTAGRERTIADIAQSELYALRHLAIGKVAPQITGTDIDGRPLRLSDFKGKVVMLTFWASGCAPCLRLVPHERALVERLAGKPFVLLGVNGDEDREQARRVVEREQINWRSWSNGGASGAITDQWKVESWPTIYVLDAEGVIRHKYKQVDKERLDAELDTLLVERPARQP